MRTSSAPFVAAVAAGRQPGIHESDIVGIAVDRAEHPFLLARMVPVGSRGDAKKNVHFAAGDQKVVDLADIAAHGHAGRHRRE